jgi:hypothetical protein
MQSVLKQLFPKCPPSPQFALFSYCCALLEREFEAHIKQFIYMLDCSCLGGYGRFEGYAVSVFTDKRVGSGIGSVVYAGRKRSAREARWPSYGSYLFLSQVANGVAMTGAAGCHNPED